MIGLALGIFVLGLIAFAAFYKLGIRFGTSETLKTKAEQINEKALEAKRIHDRLYRDDEYA
ncbi:MAG: hypothetical protein ACQEQL_05230, partial [Pseudomonadota bacterium]